MGRARGSSAASALAFETTYGTPPTSGFTQMGFVSSDLGTMQDLVPDDLMGQGRDPVAPTQDVIEGSGNMTVPVGVESMGFWLKLLLGAPSTTGSGPYTHSFVSGATTLPSASIEMGHPEIPFYEMHSGVMANELSIEMQRGRGSKLTASLGLMSQGSSEATVSGAGIPAETSFERFAHLNGSIARDGSDLGAIVMARISFNNNLDPLEEIRSDGKIGGFDPGVAALTGELRLRFDSTVLLDQASAGQACAIRMKWEIAADKSIEFHLPRIFLSKPKNPVTGPGGIEQSFNFQASQQEDGGPMFIATLINGLANYA